MLITLGEDGYLIFSWCESPYQKKVVTLPEDKATRRGINAVFRSVDGREITQKALRSLWASEKAGLVVSDGYEYALVLNDIIYNTIKERYNSLVRKRYH